MNIDLPTWQLAALQVALALVLVSLLYFYWRRLAERRAQARRIAAARLRSGHVPLEVPTTRSGLLRASDWGDGPDTGPDWGIEPPSDIPTVDETPHMRLHYIDVDGRKLRLTLQVQLLDVQRKLIIGHTGTPSDVRKIFLHQVLSARAADSGRRFDVDAWAEAVRVARRRRGAH